MVASSSKSSSPTLAGEFLGDYNAVKGQLAENLTKRLFKRLGMRTVDTGVEHTHPELSSLRSAGLIARNALADVRKSPDLAVVVRDHGKTGAHRFKAVSVEVKFREAGKITLSELQDYAGHSNPDFVFLFFDRKGIRALEAKDIKRMAKPVGRGRYRDDYVVFEDCPTLDQIPVFGFSGRQKQDIRVFERMSADMLSSLSMNRTMERKITGWSASPPPP